MAKTQGIESNRYMGNSIVINQFEKKGISMTSLKIIVPYEHVTAYRIEWKSSFGEFSLAWGEWFTVTVKL